MFYILAGMVQMYCIYKTIHNLSIYLENDEYPDDNYGHNDVDSADEQTDFSDDSENVSHRL